MPIEDWWPFFKGLAFGIVIGVGSLLAGVIVHAWTS